MRMVTFRRTGGPYVCLTAASRSPCPGDSAQASEALQIRASFGGWAHHVLLAAAIFFLHIVDASAFVVDFVMPSGVSLHTAPLLRVLTQNVPLRYCNSAAVTMTLESDDALDFPCTVVECAPSYLTVQAPLLNRTGPHSITVTIDDVSETLSRALSVHAETSAIADVSPPLMFIQPGESSAPVQIRLFRDKLPSADVGSLSVVVEFVSTYRDESLNCRVQGFSEVPDRPELIALSCSIIVPSESKRPSAAVGSPHSVLVILTASGATVTHSLYDCLLTMAPFAVARVDPAPVVLATAQEPRTLTLINGARDGFLFVGLGPVRVRVLVPSGSITVDDTATVVSAGSLTFTYTSDNAALGLATLAVGALDTAGTFVSMFELPELLTVVAELPALQRVLAVYPPLLDMRAFGAGAIVAVHVEGGVPSKVAVTAGSSHVHVVKTGGHGVVIRLLSPPMHNDVLLSIVVSDIATGLVLAHAPTLFQTGAFGASAAFDAFPPALATEQDEPARLRNVFVRGVNLTAVHSCVAWHRGVPTSAFLSRMPDPESVFDVMLNVQISPQLEPGSWVTLDFFETDPEALEAALARLGADAGGRRRLAASGGRLLSYELAVVDQRVRVLSPSLVTCAIDETCPTDFQVGFVYDIGPFPFRLFFGMDMASSEEVMQSNGTLAALGVNLRGHDAEAMVMYPQLAVWDLYRPGTLTEVGSMATLSLDVILCTNAPRIQQIVPNTASVNSTLKNVMVLTSRLFSTISAIDLYVGSRRAHITAHGAFFVMADLGKSAVPLEPMAYDVTLHYRNELVTTLVAAFTFATTSGTVDSISPAWILTSRNPAEFQVTGAGLNDVFLVRLVASPDVLAETTQTRPSMDGRSLAFIVVIDEPGVYVVSILDYSRNVIATTALVAVARPQLSLLEPNGTIPLGPWPTQNRPEPDRALASVTLQFAADSMLLRLPVEFFAVFESDGSDAPGVAISHTSMSGTTSMLVIRQRRGVDILPADYRLCFRSLIEADVMATTHEFHGLQALLSFDHNELVPEVIQIEPREVHSAVFSVETSHYRKLVLALKNADGNLPTRALLRAVIGGQSAPVLAVGNNYIVLVFSNSSVAKGEHLEIGVYNTLSERTVLHFVGFVLRGTLADTLQPLGLAAPRVYAPGGVVVTIRIYGVSGFLSITSVMALWLNCVITEQTDTLIACQLDTADLQFEPSVEVGLFVKSAQQPTARFALTLIPRITVAKTLVTRVQYDMVHVTVHYISDRDLSTVPVAPRLAGVSAQLSNVSITANVISFVARRSSGAMDTTVELYDVVVDSLLPLTTLDAPVSFPRDSTNWIVWAVAFGLLSAVLFAAAAIVAVKTGLVCKKSDSDDDEDDEDDEYEFEDSPHHVGTTRKTPYQSLQ